MPDSDSVPAAIATTAAASTHAAARRPAAGPRCAGRRAASTCWRWPSRPSACRGRRRRSPPATKNSPMSRSAPTSGRGRSGSTTSTTRYGTSATTGASWKTRRSAAAGTMSSFCTNFTPSATSWAQPWKPPAYIGPSRPCMCAITLCSVCPTSSGSTRNAASTATSRATATSQRSELSGHGPSTSGARTPGAGPGTPGGSILRRGRPAPCVALPRLLGPRPRPWRPGRPARTSLRSGCPRSRPAAAAAQAEVRAVGDRRSRCRTSRASRARARRHRGRLR